MSEIVQNSLFQISQLTVINSVRILKIHNQSLSCWRMGHASPPRLQEYYLWLCRLEGVSGLAQAGVGGGLLVSQHAYHKGRGTGNDTKQISWIGLLLPGIEHSAVNFL